MKLFNYKKFVCILLLILLIDVSIQLNLKKEGENSTLNTKVKFMSWVKKRDIQRRREENSYATAGKTLKLAPEYTETMSDQGGRPAPKPMGKINQEPVDYAKAWLKMFGTEDRPVSVCKVGQMDFKPVKTATPDADLPQSMLPAAKENVHYNKFGFEDAAYVFDYLDSILGNEIVTQIKSLWDSALQAKPDGKVKNVYEYATRLSYYASMGGTGADAIPFDVKVEKDQMKICQALKTFEPTIDPSIMIAGIKMTQMTEIYKMFKMEKPNLVGWQKKKLDQYDFDGDGSLSAVEFLFLVIWENKTRLDDPKLFGAITKSKLDPIFEYCDCDSDGLISAESVWNCFRELQRPDQSRYNYYDCRSPKNKNYVRTASTNDVVLKNGEEIQGMLNRLEFQKAIILGFWDRQVTGNDILPINETSNNLKDLRWNGDGAEDRKCPSA